MPYIEYAGNMHAHTLYSDGTWSHRGLAEAAAQAGLNYLIVTDHNVWVSGVEGFYGAPFPNGLLLLAGEEVHDCRRSTQANHMLVYGAERELATEAGSPQRLLDLAREAGALAFLAHPVEFAGRAAGEGTFPWVDWDISGYTGIEIWNYMSEFKARLPTLLHAVYYAYFPLGAIRGPFRQTLQLWDRLLASGQRVVGIGGADAHGTTYSLGPLRRVIFPYTYLFKAVNTHILAPQRFSGDLASDKALVLEALRAGRCWVGCDLLGSTRGFSFSARSSAASAILGEELRRHGAVTFQVQTPLAGDIRLVMGGRVVAHATATQLQFTTAEAGPYRVEVYRHGKGWIFSNPIYVS
ncbi:MAG: CehA/McbA family metallohydrolase [Thermoflexales bacterium]|nr:CehA/McbA family metallohydrolase [Thermoflexales bacterium]